MDSTVMFRNEYGHRRNRRHWWLNVDGTVGGNCAWRRWQRRFPQQQVFDSKSSEEKGDYIRAKTPQRQHENGSLKRQLQDISAEIGIIKSALGSAVAVGTPGTVHCVEAARLEKKDIAAQTAEAYAKGEVAGRAEGERQASEEREKEIAAQTTEAYAAGVAAGRAEGERQASEERAAREAAEATVPDIAECVTAEEGNGDSSRSTTFAVGDRVWGYKAKYTHWYPAIVTAADPGPRGVHPEQAERYGILYDDGESGADMRLCDVGHPDNFTDEDDEDAPSSSFEAAAVARDVEGAALRSSEPKCLAAQVAANVAAAARAETWAVARDVEGAALRSSEPKCLAAQVAAQDQRVEGMRAPVPGQATVLIQDFKIDEVIVRAQHLLGGADAGMRVLQDPKIPQVISCYPVPGLITLLDTIIAAPAAVAEAAGVRCHAELVGLVRGMLRRMADAGDLPLCISEEIRLGSFGPILRALDRRPNAREVKKVRAALTKAPGFVGTAQAAGPRPPEWQRVRAASTSAPGLASPISQKGLVKNATR